MNNFEPFEEMNGHFQILGGLVRSAGLEFDTLLGILFGVPSEINKVAKNKWLERRGEIFKAFPPEANLNIEQALQNLFLMGYGTCLLDVKRCEAAQSGAKEANDKDR